MFAMKSVDGPFGGYLSLYPVAPGGWGAVSFCSRAGECHGACADQFDDAELTHLVDEGGHLAVVTGDLEDQGVAVHVHDPGAEVLRYLPYLNPRLGRVDGNLDEHEFAVHVRGVRVVDHLDHVDQLLQLLLDLFDRVLTAGQHQGGAAEAFLLALGDGQALDVEAAAGDQSGDADQHARAVTHGDADDVFHTPTSSRSWSPMIISSRPA